MAEVSYGAVIERAYKMVDELRAKRTVDDESVIALYGTLYEALRQEVHFVLSAIPTSENEKRIRLLIGRYVIGCKDKNRVVWLGAIKPIETRIALLLKRKHADVRVIQQYMDLYDNFMALASYRSFEHFCLYMESDWEKKVWKPTLNIFKGWYYYATKMVLDGDVNFIEKQLPVAYGKSLSDNFLIAWIFGQCIDDDVIKVFGNKYNCGRAFDTITDLMCDARYAKVFPYYAQFGGKRDNIFEICKQSEGTFKISGSQKPVNFLCVGKESKISGVRAKYFFLDDITQAEDAGKITAHDRDIYTYETVWSKRFYSNRTSRLIIGGTTYSQFDILSYLKKKFNIAGAVPSRVNKYTKVAYSNEFVENGISVFICVPKLDYETDESTYPAEFSTEKARKEREDNYAVFMAMNQQEPLSPQDCPFFMDNLNQYEDLPIIGSKERSIYHNAYIDTKRKGNDFCAMVIGSKIQDKHYVIDGIYDQRPMQDIYESIVAKIIQHNIIELVIENNINEGLATLLTKMLREHEYYNCKITEIYNNEKKDDRIAGEEANIKARMVFPKFGMYPRSSQLGMAMDEMYGYSYKRKNDHDDWTDACAGYSRAFINNSYGQQAPLITFAR